MAKTNDINSSAKIRSRKKRGGPARTKMSRASDPPILVGGGGSTLIWVRNDFTLTQIGLSQVKPGAPLPNPTPTNYQIYEVGVDVTNSTVRLNQSGGQSKHTGMDPKKHSTRFDS